MILRFWKCQYRILGDIMSYVLLYVKYAYMYGYVTALVLYLQCYVQLFYIFAIADYPFSTCYLIPLHFPFSLGL